MPTLWITSRHTKASFQSERIVIKPLDGESDLTGTRTIPLIDVDSVVCGESTQLTTPLIHLLLSKSIPIYFLNAIGQVHGQFLPPTPHHGQTRSQQYQLLQSAQHKEAIAGELIAAKIYNQRRCVQRIGLNREIQQPTATEDFFKHLQSAIRRLEKGGYNTDQILGIEGAASADYFAQWSKFLPEEFPFDRRSRRPPLNPVNACISFASTLIYQEMLSACFAAGLDPALAALHTTDNKRWSLPLDLIEPFRPPLVEALTLDLFSRGILNQDHFEPKNGGIYLNYQGRNKLILQYEKRMERHFHSEHIGQRTTMRIQIRATPQSFKKHLNEQAEFKPFRMN